MPAPIEIRLATELAIKPKQVLATIALLDEGATVPFIARYRKEVTEGLDDTQLRQLAERLEYLREMDQRRDVILGAITEQGKLTDELAASLDAADSKQRLEDLYAPYKKKRRTKAQIAREAGLEALADALLADPELEPEVAASAYLREAFTGPDGDNPGVPDAKSALDGARQILMERTAEDADLVGRLRAEMLSRGVLVSAVAEGKEEAGAKYSDYFAYQEKLADVPSHRALALLRGRREEILTLTLALPDDPEPTEGPGWCQQQIAQRMGVASQGRAADKWLNETARWTWQVKLSWQIATDLMGAMREQAEAEAIDVFGRNLKALLLAAPAGRRATIGLDPGLRTGVKVAVVDNTGKLVATETIYPHPPRKDFDGAIKTLAALAKTHAAELVAIGNGTGSRETDKLVADLISAHPDLGLTRIMVSEAGASVYSASALAAKEFPDVDVSLRGAVSIARRLQDPLAELVKIEPKAIGVGQYQHDVSQSRLAKALDGVVEDCVNGVGVDVNTASAPLLSRIAGLSNTLAENIVKHRDDHGAFVNRQALLKVSRLGERSFEQAAGFLRVMDGENPLDASAVHPEAYPVVEKMLADIQKGISQVIGQPAVIKTLTPEKYVDDRFGLPTVRDIVKELEKPGRDPRPAFKTAAFRDGVEKITDLQPGMTLEGVVTNVAAFGAFVDVGVHQDGLVHISALANRYVSDPHAVVKAGDVVKVKVLEVDPKRKRIGLTMRLDDGAPSGASTEKQTPGNKRARGKRPDQKGRNGAGQRPGADAARNGKNRSDRQDRSKHADRPNRGGRQDDQPSAMALALAAARKKG
ncbi:MAG: Tex family protein [Burkholderiaceae bacterium]